MKDIVILADFCGPLDGTFNSRFLYLADLLSKDNNVEIITSDFNHGNKEYIGYEIEKHEYKITMLHELAYHKNICLKRFWGHYIWGKNVKKYLQNRQKPDVIYCAIPTLMASYEAAKYCESNNIKFIIDIQDLWPEAFQMAFNPPIISNVIYAPFNILANKIYKRADVVCAVSDTYCKRALSVNKKTKLGVTVFLGTDIRNFDGYVKENLVEKKDDELWLGYCGTLGASYDITIAIDALKIIADRGVSVPKFIVLGDGERKNEFEQHAKALGVDCVFTGRLPYEEMCGWLSACDIAVNPIMHNAAQSIINKHADYAASGIPVLNTQECKEYRRLVKEYKMGFNCKNGDAEGLADRIELLIKNKELCMKMGKNARICAEEKFDRQNSYQKLVNVIKNR